MYNDATSPIRYRLTKDDFVNFQLYLAKQSPFIQRQIRLAIFSVSAAIGMLFYICVIEFAKRFAEISGIFLILMLFGAFGVVLLSAAILYRFYPNPLAKYYSKYFDAHEMKSSFDEAALWLKDRGILYRDENGSEALVSWVSFRKIETTEDYAYIFHDATRAWIVPKRAFADDSEFDEFVRVVQENIQVNSTSTEKSAQSSDG